MMSGKILKALIIHLTENKYCHYKTLADYHNVVFIKVVFNLPSLDSEPSHHVSGVLLFLAHVDVLTGPE